jgi:sucrose-6-phosphate hydrolase SacC (GH32 family)
MMDQQGCGENDPNGPVFDPVHGVIHHFYQIHLAAPPGHGPDYGHFVSKDFINWAPVRLASKDFIFVSRNF